MHLEIAAFKITGKLILKTSVLDLTSLLEHGVKALWQYDNFHVSKYEFPAERENEED